MLATIDKPAVVTAKRALETTLRKNVTPSQSTRVIVTVSGFKPPLDGGSVEVVVKAAKDDSGAEQEIGRFGLSLPVEFKATEPAKAQSFGLVVPEELASRGALKLNVYVVPSNGDGKGARLQVGSAEIR